MECVGNCARHCPTGAIQMVASDPDKADSLKIPVVNVENALVAERVKTFVRPVLSAPFM